MPRDHREVIHLPLTSRIKDGRIFEISTRSDSGVIYLRCRARFCSGTAKIMPHSDVIVNGHNHSAICYEERDAQLKADFIEALKSAMQRHYWKLKEVYETVAAMFPVEIKQQIPFNSIKSSLKRWRRLNFPACPETLEIMANQLEDPENLRLLEYDMGRLTCRRIEDAGGHLHVLIYDQQLVLNEFADVTRVFIDGTFQTTPQITGVYQLVSVLGVKYDHALPFAHILMANKTQVAYTAVLEAVQDRLINTASVAVVMADFEQALRNACRTIFVNAKIVGCNVHYDRAVLKKIKSLGLAPLLREDAAAKLFVKKVLALAYLPAINIEAQYHVLKGNLTPIVERRFRAFLAYYERQWLRMVEPAGFSVFGLSRRTNNVIESYNSILADKLGEHPSAWTFIGKLTKLTSNARDDLQSLRLGRTIRRHPRYSTVYKNRELTKAWRQLHCNRITIGEFIEKAAMLKGHVAQRIMRIPDAEAQPDEDILEAEIYNNLDDPDYDREAFAGVPNHFMMDDAVEAAEAEIHAIDNMLEAQEMHVENERIEPENDALYFFNQSDEDAELPAVFDREDALSEQSADVEEVGMDEPNDDRDSNADNEAISDNDVEEVGMNELNHDGNSNGGDEAIADNEVALPAQPNPRVSASRKKNLRKKRRHQMKAQNQQVVRSYGHKRRKTKKVPKCVVCQVAEITHGFVPCGHNCSCRNCARIIGSGLRQHCPKCRTPFREIIQIFNE